MNAHTHTPKTAGSLKEKATVPGELLAYEPDAAHIVLGSCSSPPPPDKHTFPLLSHAHCSAAIKFTEEKKCFNSCE